MLEGHVNHTRNADNVFVIAKQKKILTMCQQSKITIILSFNPVVKDEVTLSNS